MIHEILVVIMVISFSSMLVSASLMNEDSAMNICKGEGYKGFELQSCVIDSRMITSQWLIISAAVFFAPVVYYILSFLTEKIDAQYKDKTNV